MKETVDSSLLLVVLLINHDPFMDLWILNLIQQLKVFL